MPYSDDYIQSACESGHGNMNMVVKEYEFTGAEAADTTIKMAKMHDKNTYARVTVLPDASMVGAIDIGYADRDDGGSDSLDAFGDGLDLATANQAGITSAPVAVAFNHDIALTIKTNNAGNSGKKVTLMIEFINAAG